MVEKQNATCMAVYHVIKLQTIFFPINHRDVSFLW
jgi:hypothetical protein